MVAKGGGWGLLYWIHLQLMVWSKKYWHLKKFFSHKLGRYIIVDKTRSISAFIHKIAWKKDLKIYLYCLFKNTVPKFTLIYISFLCHFIQPKSLDQAEGHHFWQRLWLFCFPFLFPPKKRGKRKGEWSNKNNDQKSYLSARSKFGISNMSILTLYIVRYNRNLNWDCLTALNFLHLHTN